MASLVLSANKEMLSYTFCQCAMAANIRPPDQHSTYPSHHSFLSHDITSRTYGILELKLASYPFHNDNIQGDSLLRTQMLIHMSDIVRLNNPLTLLALFIRAMLHFGSTYTETTQVIGGQSMLLALLFQDRNGVRFLLSYFLCN